jgi:protein tyrosine/serine phosphatase
MANSADFQEIVPGLYLGGTPPIFDFEVNANAEFTEYEGLDYVFTFHKSSSAVIGRTIEIRYFFQDDWEKGLDPADIETLKILIDEAHSLWKAGKQVMLRCQGGKNRSGLIAASVLMRDGYSADEAIELLRERRTSDVLFNVHFVDALRNGVLS